MFFKKVISLIIIFSFGFLNIQAYSQQRIKDFYLSNFKEDGQRDWELRGDEATIHEKYVDIDTMKANYYLKDDTILITSDTARLDKTNLDVYLKDNVHISNKEGATLVTDSLNWQKTKNLIETKDMVKTNRDSMQIIAKGLSADTELKKAEFKQDVEVTLPDEKTQEVARVTCSGPLEIEYSLGKAVFNDNVVATHTQGKMYSDKATLFFDTEKKEIIKIVSEGNVKIIRDRNVSYAEKATYSQRDQKLTLEGRPQIIYYPDDGEGSDLFN